MGNNGSESLTDSSSDIQMSALGQKQTFAAQNGMSALPPKADIRRGQLDVRFVPKAGIYGAIICPYGLALSNLCVIDRSWNVAFPSPFLELVFCDVYVFCVFT